MNRTRALIWGSSALLFVGFIGWYTDFAGPLDEAEIEMYLDRLEALGRDEDSLARIRRFMEEDTGRPFLMLNIIDYTESPPDVPGAEPGESAEELMNRYTAHMLVEFFKRACHPVVLGNAVFPALDLVGVESLPIAERWDMAAFVRYRSRRTLMEIVTIPETMARHEFKVAALDKTIAFPVEVELNLGDPRFLLALALIAGAALLDLALVRGASRG